MLESHRFRVRIRAPVIIGLLFINFAVFEDPQGLTQAEFRHEADILFTVRQLLGLVDNAKIARAAVQIEELGALAIACLKGVILCTRSRTM